MMRVVTSTVARDSYALAIATSHSATQHFNYGSQLRSASSIRQAKNEGHVFLRLDRFSV